ncbi:imidazoleglycerol-phosphate dehydratase HisB [Clostridium sp. MCC353]|uniref:imidazoleglycerol-phosphate dehydratase HisB n=1 Tax=Clostridium sp. MCC353 TaxID=2592646 RepID=UPI001C01492A|nr:imidazoleglycerol-phosphate dehydratase HisB [Clostridium sp. MCC353]MBT9775787.1 imidazoleglycerol-phosphate dehydratase HisB [Clostridium sp. MCC353]
MNRTATINRDTKETKISLTLNLDGSGKSDIHTGIGFFDHMLEGFARHGFFDLSVHVDGDLDVDTHHTIEDTGIVLGKAIKEAAGDKKGIARYGFSILPMDETLVLCALDLSGRPYFLYDLKLDREKVGDLETEMIREFFYAVSYGAEMNLHFKQLEGINNHHIIEGAFKAFAKALDQATGFDPRITGVLSTKGSLS